MFSKTLFVVAFAAIAQLVVATPPACMLGAVNTYSNPADIAAVCKAKDATSKIAKMCGSSSADALEAFADICNDAGVKVATDITATATGTATGTDVSAHPTASGNGTTLATTLATATGGSVPSGGSGGATATGTGGPAQATGAAGRFDAAAAALLAGMGFAVAVL